MSMEHVHISAIQFLTGFILNPDMITLFACKFLPGY